VRSISLSLSLSLSDAVAGDSSTVFTHNSYGEVPLSHTMFASIWYAKKLGRRLLQNARKAKMQKVGVGDIHLLLLEFTPKNMTLFEVLLNPNCLAEGGFVVEVSLG